MATIFPSLFDQAYAIYPFKFLFLAHSYGTVNGAILKINIKITVKSTEFGLIFTPLDYSFGQTKEYIY